MPHFVYFFNYLKRIRNVYRIQFEYNIYFNTNNDPFLPNVAKIIENLAIFVVFSSKCRFFWEGEYSDCFREKRCCSNNIFCIDQLCMMTNVFSKLRNFHEKVIAISYSKSWQIFVFFAVCVYFCFSNVLI